MARFDGKLTVTKIDAHLWIVEIPFKYFIGPDEKEVVTVIDGTLTDFASVPGIFWTLLPPDGEYTQAAVLHDFIYKGHVFDRKKCDDVFYEAMGVLNVPGWKRWIMWFCLRLFGFAAYKK